MKELSSIVKEMGFSYEQLEDTEKLEKIGEKLSAQALIRVEVNKFDFKKDDTISPVMAGDTPIIISSTDYLCDFSLSFEMVDLKKGNKILSCSSSFKEKKGNPIKLVKSIFNKCWEKGK